MCRYIATVLVIGLYLFCGVDGCWRRHKDLTVEKKIVPSNKVTEAKSKAVVAARNVSTQELKRLSEELFNLDRNNVGHLIQLNLQGITTSSATNDAASSPLFAKLPPKTFNGSTTTALHKLFDNYVELVTRDDVPTTKELKEQSDFLTAVMATPVMKKTEEFLKKHKAINGTLRNNLKVIWFTPYSRSKGKMGSSGFEHVFLGEIKNGLVSGLHNWMFFHKEEREKDVDYKGYIKVLDFGNKGEIIKLRFDWMKKRKSVGSMFVGTSPELEMALYTICFYTRPNKGCNLTMNRKKFRIKVYTQRQGKKTLVGSAFPEIF